MAAICLGLNVLKRKLTAHMIKDKTWNIENVPGPQPVNNTTLRKTKSQIL